MPLLNGGFIRRLHPAGTLYLTLSYADLPEAYCRAKFAAAGVHQASRQNYSALMKKRADRKIAQETKYEFTQPRIHF